MGAKKLALVLVVLGVREIVELVTFIEGEFWSTRARLNPEVRLEFGDIIVGQVITTANYIEYGDDVRRLTLLGIDFCAADRKVWILFFGYGRRFWLRLDVQLLFNQYPTDSTADTPTHPTNNDQRKQKTKRRSSSYSLAS